MKTAIFPSLQQFSSKNSKNVNVYDDQILKKLKLQCQCKIMQNVRFTLQITRFMKTALLQCLQQFYSKNSKHVYHDQILKKLKLQSKCKIVQNVRCSLQITPFMKTAILQCFQQFSSKNSKNVNVYHDQILKTLKLQCQCKIVQNVRFSL